MENAKILDDNLLLLKQRIQDSRFMPDCLNLKAPTVRLAHSRGGLPVAKVMGEQHRWVTLHSMVDPVREAEKFAACMPAKDRSLTILLGLGSGYHAEALLARGGNNPVIIVEKEPCLVRFFLERTRLQGLCDDRQIYFLCGPDREDILSKIYLLQLKHGGLPYHTVAHAPSCRSFPGFYEYIRAGVSASKRSGIGSKFNYGKFISPEARVLILHSKYYLLQEIISALRTLGHEARTIMLPGEGKGQGSQEVLESIIDAIVSYRPDFILTVNHLGFDREGMLTQFFTDIRLPFASWYVDSPVFILENYSKQRSPYLSIFVWDSDYIADLQKRGFQNVFYLPLATDTSVFRPVPAGANPMQHLECSVGFVGNSSVGIVSECLKKIGADEDARLLLNKVALQFRQSGERRLDDTRLRLTPMEQHNFDRLLEADRATVEPAVTWMATQQYRLECVRELLRFKPAIYGDPGWGTLLNGDSRLGPELNYYDELPYFYNACAVNFNTTSLQMKGGVNQRVFDVPACGAFLLTDYRKQIENLFEPGQESICFTHTGEIGDLVAFYKRHPGTANRIASKARRRVLAQHTYSHRLQDLMGHMRQLYG